MEYPNIEIPKWMTDKIVTNSLEEDFKEIDDY